YICTITMAISTPDVTPLLWRIPWRTSFMWKSEKKPLRNYVPISEISPHLRTAVILAEDDRFEEHEGVDWKAIKKAAEINMQRGKFSRGGSTITMQLAKNLYLSPDKNLFRKLKEMLITFKLENTLSKERILEIYLNVAEWGNGIFGAEAAANHYFGKKAKHLSRHEAAFLAAILPRPKFYDRNRGGPYLQRRISSIEGRL
ncbi:MAG TPA: monofunctional biosynthetic peptidoglycan transglycosylase, partial [bacterium]|nr:monofunctional biosynthetic peptidoglycan transglycosylase [bacterium]